MGYTVSPEFSRIISKMVSNSDNKDDSAAISVEEETLGKYIRYIVKQANKYTRPRVEFEDLIMQGVIGVIEAVRKYNPEKSHDLHGWICMFIKSEMFKYLIENESPTHIPANIGRAKVLVAKLRRLVEHEPILFNSNTSVDSLISVYQHTLENKFVGKRKEKIKDLKKRIRKIATDSSMTYENLLILVKKNEYVEIPETTGRNSVETTNKPLIEDRLVIKEVENVLTEALGEKKTRILFLHHQNVSCEEIADTIHREGLTERRITRQGVHSHIKKSKKDAKEHIKD